MAVSMSAALVISTQQGTVCAGRKFTATITLTEGGGTATALTSIQPYMMNGSSVMSTNVRFGGYQNATTNAGLTGAAITIAASTAYMFNFDVVIDGPDQIGAPAEPICDYLLGATCQTSDGSVFSPTPVRVQLMPRQSGPVGVYATPSPVPNEKLGTTLVLGTTTNAYGNTVQQGALRGDIGSNSGGFLIAGIIL